jgi:excisionase family DNA binding protein
MEPTLLRPPEVAHQLGLGRSKVYQLMATGDLRTVHIGRAVRIPAAEVEAFVARRLVEGDAQRSA